MTNCSLTQQHLLTQLFVKPSKNSKIVSKYEADTMDDECYCSQRANCKAQWILPTGPDGGGNGDQTMSNIVSVCTEKGPSVWKRMRQRWICQVVILFCSCAVWRHLGVRDGHTKLYRQIFPHPSATHISIWLLKMTHPCQVFDWVRIFWQLTMFPVVWKTKSTTETFMSKKKNS